MRKNLAPEDSMVVIGLHRIVSEMDRVTKQISKQQNLTLGQFAVLEALYNKGELTVGEVKDLVLSTDGTIPVITGNLEKMGYLTRRQDTQDKRKYMLSLTGKGKEVIREAAPKNSEALEDLLSIWSSEEKKLLRTMIQKFRSGRS